MPDTTDTQSERLSRLFELHNARLVRALRARLGRYNWHLAEDIAAATWLRAVQKIGRIPAGDKQAFEWLLALAWAAQCSHFRLAREVPTDFSGRGAYKLPPAPAAEDIALARITQFVRSTDAGPAPVAVAA
jgi:DNA-directed RNA polymerase specialized sigma24 family protein